MGSNIRLLNEICNKKEKKYKSIKKHYKIVKPRLPKISGYDYADIIINMFYTYKKI